MNDIRRSEVVPGVEDVISVPPSLEGEELTFGAFALDEFSRMRKIGERFLSPVHCVDPHIPEEREIVVRYFTAYRRRDSHRDLQGRRERLSISSYEVIESMIEAGHRPLVDPEAFSLLFNQRRILGRRWDVRASVGPVHFAFLGSVFVPQKETGATCILFMTQGTRPQLKWHKTHDSIWEGDVYFPATELREGEQIHRHFPRPSRTFHWNDNFLDD